MGVNSVGDLVGDNTGDILGWDEGEFVADITGEDVGCLVTMIGEWLGEEVGGRVGDGVGDCVGQATSSHKHNTLCFSLHETESESGCTTPFDERFDIQDVMSDQYVLEQVSSDIVPVNKVQGEQ